MHWPVHHFDAVGSTNEEARLAASRSERAEGWFVADRQLAGKARRGRSWTSEPGNLYASLLLFDAAPLARLGTLPFVAALAVRDALAPLLPDVDRRLKLKWPNDILLDGFKINGILLENVHLPEGGQAVICGFGINLAHYPGGTETPAADLRSAGIDLTPVQMLQRLDRTFHDNLSCWNRGEGFADIRRRWIDHSIGIGKPIRVRLANETLFGRFAGVDEQGYLLLDDAAGPQQRIHAGDLFFDFERTV